MGSALAVGPIISGVLLTWFPWRALFALFFIIAVAVFVVSFITIKDVMPLQPNQLDWLSVVLAASFPALLYVLSSATNQGMTATLGIITVLGCMGAIWFVRRQLNQERPILQLRVFATRLFTQSVLMTGISYIALIVTTIIMPLYFQNVLHVSPLVSGLSLVPAAVGLSLLNPRAGKMLDRLGPRKVALTGMTLIVIGFTLMTLLVGHLPLWLAIICAMVTEAGNAFVMMPSVTAGANALPRDLIADGTAVTTTVRQLLGSLGVAVATMILQTVQQGTGSAVSGFRATFASFALVGVVGWLLATRLPRVQERE